MENNIPKIKPIQTKEYETKQSKYNVVSKLPLRSIVLGPSGSGKSILLQNMILDIYRDCFSRIYIFSPSINVDYQTWEPVKKYIDKNIQNTHDEEFYFDNFDEAALTDIINTQRKITYQK
jgi:ABC-type lipoprotein export system ATPase subunit